MEYSKNTLNWNTNFIDCVIGAEHAFAFDDSKWFSLVPKEWEEDFKNRKIKGRITVEDILITTGLESNKVLVRSKNGLTSPNSCKIQNSDEECFRGYVCLIDKCEKCHYSCSQCYNGNGYNSCKKCSPLTISEDQNPINGLCPINFVDISQFKDFSIDIYPNGDEFNERATIGLWLFFSDLTNSRSLENDIYHIVLENRIVISLHPGDDQLTAYCHTFEDLYRKVTSDTRLYASYADKSSEYVVSDVIPATGNTKPADYITVTFTSDSTK